MLSVKQLALEALQGPGHRALQNAFETAQPQAWDTRGNVKHCTPLRALRVLREQLDLLCRCRPSHARSATVIGCKLEVTEVTHAKYRVVLYATLMVGGESRHVEKCWDLR